MKFDPDKHHRRSIRIQGYDYAAPGGYFVTLITRGRICLFGDLVDQCMQLSPMGLIVEECWRAIPEHFAAAELGAYVVMPNHVHGIILLHERVDAFRPAMTLPQQYGESTSENRSAKKSPTVGATHWVAPTNSAVDRSGRSSVRTKWR
jgi:REP element-mobilizing transposase RayT